MLRVHCQIISPMVLQKVSMCCRVNCIMKQLVYQFRIVNIDMLHRSDQNPTKTHKFIFIYINNECIYCSFS